jgi:hypothetical protein
MPDAQTFLLPAHAYLLSQRDQNVPLRRAALADPTAHYEEVEKASWSTSRSSR